MNLRSLNLTQRSQHKQERYILSTTIIINATIYDSITRKRSLSLLFFKIYAQ